MDREVLDTIPSSGLRTSLAALIPGVDFERQDVGGAGTRAVTGGPTVHGRRGQEIPERRFNGISISSFGVSAGTSTIFMNPMAIEEVQIDTGSNSADLHAGGVRANYVPKEGGNAFSGVVFGAYAPGRLQSDNLTDELIARGLATPNNIKANWDINPGFGGPIMRDRIWFYFAARYNVTADYVAGLFYNRNTNNPDAWTYEPDTSRRVWNEQKQPDTQARVTWQLRSTEQGGLHLVRHHLLLLPDRCRPHALLGSRHASRYPLQRLIAGDWTMPATNRLLFDVRGQLYRSESNRIPWDGLNPKTIVPVQEQATGMRFRAGDTYRTSFRPCITGRARVVHERFPRVQGGGQRQVRRRPLHRLRPLAGELSREKRVPNRITQRAMPPLAAMAGWKGDVDADLGLYVQDRWTMDKLSLNYGLRYDYFHNSYPEQTSVLPVLAPNRNITFPAQDGWTLHDLSPRLGAVYDVTGAGKTAIKASLNRYLLAMGPDVSFIQLANPSRNLILTATRTWTDTDGDFIPDCDLTAATPGRNGECGPLSDANFGTAVSNVTFDEDALTGWGQRNFNWEFSAGVQQELMPNVSLDVSYFRRW